VVLRRRLVPIYLVAKGIDLRNGLLAVWVPFIAADLGNFLGGGTSGYLIKKGWSLGAARKAVVVFGGIGVTLLIPTIFTTNLYAITALFAVSVLLRLFQHHRQCPSVRFVSERSGRHGQRFERDGSRFGHHRGVPVDWPLLRSPAGYGHARV
jgi:hypothetical protein